MSVAETKLLLPVAIVLLPVLITLIARRLLDGFANKGHTTKRLSHAQRFSPAVMLPLRSQDVRGANPADNVSFSTLFFSFFRFSKLINYS